MVKVLLPIKSLPDTGPKAIVIIGVQKITNINAYYLCDICKCICILSAYNLYSLLVSHIQGGFFNSPPKKLKYVKPRLGVSTLT